jgi:hypothetical protein
MMDVVMGAPRAACIDAARTPAMLADGSVWATLGGSASPTPVAQYG